MVEPWFKINCVRFHNPIDPSRFIYFWSCGTHLLKSLRNNLYQRQPKLARDFKIRGVLFGCGNVEQVHIRDEERISKQKGRQTDIVKYAIKLDKYMLMNDTYAKQHFSEKTISEVLIFLSGQLKANVDINKKFAL